MDKIIIIGNGFDLAHGLDTRYIDFMGDYINSVLIKILNGNRYEDELLEIYSDSTIRINNPDEDCSDREEKKYSRPIDTYINFIQDKAHITKNYKSPLLKKILLQPKTAPNWYDLEQMYFSLLYEKATSVTKQHTKPTLDEFLMQFDYLKKLLFEYLGKIELDVDASVRRLRKAYYDLFVQNATQKGVLGSGSDITHISFVNFNYTNTLNWYIDEIDKYHNCSKSSHFHGDLKMEICDPIFGFGDVQDERYQKLLSMNDDRLIKNIKSFEYLNSNNLTELNGNLSSLPFEVDVYGHALGLSDRTLLNSIFENNRCEKIRIFYHVNSKDEDDYFAKAANIARIFIDQTSWVNKIQTKPLSSAMPQLSDFK